MTRDTQCPLSWPFGRSWRQDTSAIGRPEGRSQPSVAVIHFEPVHPGVSTMTGCLSSLMRLESLRKVRLRRYEAADGAECRGLANSERRVVEKPAIKLPPPWRRCASARTVQKVELIGRFPPMPPQSTDRLIPEALPSPRDDFSRLHQDAFDWLPVYRFLERRPDNSDLNGHQGLYWTSLDKADVARYRANRWIPDIRLNGYRRLDGRNSGTDAGLTGACARPQPNARQLTRVLPGPDVRGISSSNGQSVAGRGGPGWARLYGFTARARSRSRSPNNGLLGLYNWDFPGSNPEFGARRSGSRCR